MTSFAWVSRATLVCACSIFVTGCSTVGPSRLRADQVNYERALGDAKKREMLATVVGLRFGDAPSFVTVSQIIAAYNFDASGGPILNLGSGSIPNYAEGTATFSYANHPTFTFTPVTGEAYATAYIRPLPTSLILPLADSGMPIDLLLRVAVQSIGDLQNAAPLGGANSDGSPGFFELLRALRRLQLAGELTLEYKDVDKVQHISLTLGANTTTEPAQNRQDIDTVRRLLHLPETAATYEIVNASGASAPRGATITMVTRSVLGILSNLGAQIEVPDDAIAGGETKPTVHLVGGETRPTVVVHEGSGAPSGAYVAIEYDANWYWIDRADFDSKYAFTVVQNIIALAEATQDTKAPIVTIPAN
ncbi:hypothetical protein [Pararobbsia silviterrae]|uniref:Uncharacterized protein n=1 Tax=Pararobbsia silviterrae TaxID=1792498 RepID=A0A494Y4G3_9BURK|nr:hypothetical protein [Pararobbsia silviterrae]RKP57578.1 hypothetical protein D7S86_06395 [Pararobbsia silviterrae]